MTIVLAWTEVVREWDHQPFQMDLGATPRMVDVVKPYAAVWLNKGADADLDKAREYAKTDSRCVLTYPTTERDPLGRARRDVLKLRDL